MNQHFIWDWPWSMLMHAHGCAKAGCIASESRCIMIALAKCRLPYLLVYPQVCLRRLGQGTSRRYACQLLQWQSIGGSKVFTWEKGTRQFLDPDISLVSPKCPLPVCSHNSHRRVLLLSVQLVKSLTTSLCCRQAFSIAAC